MMFCWSLALLMQANSVKVLLSVLHWSVLQPLLSQVVPFFSTIAPLSVSLQEVQPSLTKIPSFLPSEESGIESKIIVRPMIESEIWKTF